jgi:hypothetical protein
MKMIRIGVMLIAALLGIWIVLEVGVRVYLEHPHKADFYGSITHSQVQSL